MDERVIGWLNWVEKLQSENKQIFEAELRTLLKELNLSEDGLVKLLEFLADWRATAERDYLAKRLP